MPMDGRFRPSEGYPEISCNRPTAYVAFVRKDSAKPRNIIPFVRNGLLQGLTT